VLPNVDADDRVVREKRVLVSRRDDFELAGGRVGTLKSQKDQSRYLKKRIQPPVGGRRTSQPQPEPWIPAVVVLNSFVKFGTDPQRSQMAFLRGPSWSFPPWPLSSLAEGARFLQKRE